MQVSVVFILAEISAAVLEALSIQSTWTVTEGKFDMYEMDLHPFLKWYSYHVSWSQLHWMNYKWRPKDATI